MNGETSDRAESEEVRRHLREHIRRLPIRSGWRWPDKDVAEMDAVRIAFESTGVAYERLQANDHDPPDCIALVADAVWGIEVTELVDRESLEASISGLKALPPGADFLQQAAAVMHRVWDRGLFVERLQQCVAAKDIPPESRSGGPFDRYLVVIPTSEYYLDADHVGSFLEGAVIRAAHVDEVVLLLPYDLAAGRYPVFRIRPAG